MRCSVQRPSSQLEKLRWAIKWAKDDVDLVLGGGKSCCGVSQLVHWKGTETQERKLKKSSKHAFSGASLNFGCACTLIFKAMIGFFWFGWFSAYLMEGNISCTRYSCCHLHRPLWKASSHGLSGKGSKSGRRRYCRCGRGANSTT